MANNTTPATNFHKNATPRSMLEFKRAIGTRHYAIGGSVASASGLSGASGPSLTPPQLMSPTVLCLLNCSTAALCAVPLLDLERDFHSISIRDAAVDSSCILWPSAK